MMIDMRRKKMSPIEEAEYTKDMGDFCENTPTNYDDKESLTEKGIAVIAKLIEFCRGKNVKIEIQEAMSLFEYRQIINKAKGLER